MWRFIASLEHAWEALLEMNYLDRSCDESYQAQISQSNCLNYSKSQHYQHANRCQQFKWRSREISLETKTLGTNSSSGSHFLFSAPIDKSCRSEVIASWQYQGSCNWCCLIVPSLTAIADPWEKSISAPEPSSWPWESALRQGEFLQEPIVLFILRCRAQIYDYT